MGEKKDWVGRAAKRFEERRTLKTLDEARKMPGRDTCPRDENATMMGYKDAQKPRWSDIV